MSVSFRCIDVSEVGSFNSALLCQRCDNGRSPILPPVRTDEDDDDDGDGDNVGQWRCADCGYVVEGGFAVSVADRIREELEAAKCEDPQVNRELRKASPGQISSKPDFMRTPSFS